MTTFERQQRLLTILREQPGIRVPEAASLLEVSEGTIRNDLRSLANAGQLTRVRGGGVLAEDGRVHSPIFATRLNTHRRAKQAIAAHAAALVQDNDSVILDSSTSAYHLACCLRERRDLTVITNGLETARELAKNPTNKVILLGGILRADGTAVASLLGDEFLASYHIKTAFVSCSGLTPAGGATEVDIYEAQIKMRMIASSGSTIVLIDASKFGRTDLTTFVHPGQITRLFTDAGLAPEWIGKLEQAGIPYTLCGARTEPA